MHAISWFCRDIDALCLEETSDMFDQGPLGPHLQL